MQTHDFSFFSTHRRSPAYNFFKFFFVYCSVHILVIHDSNLASQEFKDIEKLLFQTLELS